MRVAVRRIRCRECGKSGHEAITFCPDPYVRYTKWVAQFILALRREMSIKAVAGFTGLHWETVKNIEKSWLAKKYKKVKLDTVSYMGIDEVYLGKIIGYITVVRDLESGAVLFIGNGKGGDALKKFRKRIKRRAKQIKAVAIDMANSYSAWVSEVLPDADIVYDHFHVVKSMNDKLNTLRRNTMSQLEDDQKKELKGKRFLLLRNVETLSQRSKLELEKLRGQFDSLGTASAMKEYLRNIYKIAPNADIAELAFKKWCTMADDSGVSCLKTMAKTIRRRMKGMLSFWNHNRLTNASQEGFNNKIGWLTRQAYGYRDEEYLHLKIYDLPNLKMKKML
jgi:transposase